MISRFSCLYFSSYRVDNPDTTLLHPMVFELVMAFWEVWVSEFGDGDGTEDCRRRQALDPSNEALINSDR